MRFANVSGTKHKTTHDFIRKLRKSGVWEEESGKLAFHLLQCAWTLKSQWQTISDLKKVYCHTMDMENKVKLQE